MVRISKVLVVLLFLWPLPTMACSWQNKITERLQHESPIASKIWKKVLAKGVANNAGLGKDDRRVFTLIQKVAEEEMIKAILKKDINNAVMIIHSQQPPSPLRINGKLNEALNISPKARKIMEQRRINILNYLNKGGKIISVYQNTSKVQGMKEYIALLNNQTGIIDHKVKALPEKNSGATYIIRQLDGSLFAFSILSPQADLPDKAIKNEAQWSIWFGPLLNTEVSKRVVQIESFLKSENIDIYSYIGLNEQKDN